VGASNKTEVKSNTPAKTNAEPVATNIILQSKDGGQTWQDVSYSLPQNVEPEGFFAGKSEVYLRAGDDMYHSKNNLKTPMWEKETILGPQLSSIAFSRSSVMAFNYEGEMYQKVSHMGTWLPVYSNLKRKAVRTIFETADGTVFVGCDNGLYKSTDKGVSWKQVLNKGWVMELVEAEGVLVGTSALGIIRSTDKGEHWEHVISEGGVGIAIERIDGGFAAISYNASTDSRRIRISRDGGKTWDAIDNGLQPSLSISSIKQVGNYLICGHPDGIFRSSDMGKTWIKVHASVDDLPQLLAKTSNPGRVFTIYVSGNVLYAVARNGGC